MSNPANNLDLKKRYRRERIFARLGLASIIAAILFLAVLLASVGAQGWRAFIAASVQLPVVAAPQIIGADGEKSVLAYQTLVKNALAKRFPNATGRADKKQLNKLLSFGAAIVARDAIAGKRELIGTEVTLWLPAASAAERYLKGGEHNLGEQEKNWLNELRAAGQTKLQFNAAFFTSGDSRDAEAAGIGGALVGSFLSLLLAFLFSFPLGVLAAVYLQLFAPRNAWMDFVEVNINNLAAVPSVIFGLLGLAIFINFFGMPRSSPLVGGLVLALMTLPTIIISSRAALGAVPPSLLSGALSLGATKIQGVFHHVLPAAMPGILTGAIIGMAQALGETAPLLMIGMVSFITAMPENFTDAATALPVQIFLWADSPERGFRERTAAAIMVLLAFLLLMNAAAVMLRKKLEVKL